MKKFGKKFKNNELERKYRINERIRIKTVRVVGPDGTQLGVLPTEEALRTAQDYGLDLVEVAPNSRPPVCRIMDFGKMRYEHSKKQKEQKKKSAKQTTKTVRISPNIGEGDLARKIDDAQKFINKGFRVVVNCKLKGRWRQHADLAIRQMELLRDTIEDAAPEKIQRQGSDISLVINSSVQKTSPE